MNGQFSGDVVVRRKTEVEVWPQVRLPKKYVVALLNDDYTPMEFVVDILKRFFHFNEERAVQIMLHVHILGKGVCGIYTRDIAETMVAQVNDFSRSNGHPLLCTMEPE